MAVRNVKLSYRDLLGFLKAWDGDLKKGSLFIPAKSFGGKEAAAELRVDLIVPPRWRLGPLDCQVILRTPDGVGVQIPEFGASFHQQMEDIERWMDAFCALMVKRGKVMDPASMEARAAELAEERAALLVEDRAAELAEERAQALAEERVGELVEERVQTMMESGELAQAGSAGEQARVRGLVVPDLSAIEPTRAGALEGKQLREALMDFAVERKSGILQLVGEDGLTRYGLWIKGGPVMWASEPLQQDEVLGVLLFKAKQLSEEQLQESLTLMEEGDRYQGEAFLEMGLMNFAQLVKVLQKQCEYILQRVLRARGGSWSFYESDQLPNPSIIPPLRVAAVLYQSLRRFASDMPIEQLYNALRPRLDHYLEISEEALPVLQEIPWSKDERRFIEVLSSKRWRLREVFAVSNMSRMQSAITLWSMIELTLIRFDEDEGTARYLGRIEERVLPKRRRIFQEHLFDVLEVHWICLPRELEAGYKKLKAEFQPSRYKQLTPELREAMEVILKRLDEAWETLKDNRKRRTYRHEIIEETMILQSAELLAKKGEMAIMRGEGLEARMCWGKALELNPSNPEFRDGLQRANAIVT